MKFIKPSFWDKKKWTLLAICFYPLTLFTKTYNFLRSFNSKKKYDIKTICIGNIYLGGTGKTPIVQYTAKLFKKSDKVVLIKKAYKEHVDEKKLLEKNFQVFFEKTRSEALKKAVLMKKKIAIFDDGLQDPSVHYDIKIVCFNANALNGNNLLIPAGPLRENLNNLKKYDAVIVNGKKNDKFDLFKKKILTINPRLKIFSGSYDPKNFSSFQKHNYLAFCGIGNPKTFIDTLKKYKIKVKKYFLFPDHHVYNQKEIDNLKEIAKKNNLQIITTEKDHCRLSKVQASKINFLRVEIKLKDSPNFKKFIFNNL
tara:strand:+ start:86 stop:1018 length:933 start_codon:yes stop_codon:yes gene_type:complete